MYIVYVNNFSDWRKTSRELLTRGVSPENVNWEYNAQNCLPLGDEGDFMPLPIRHKTLSIPKTFITLAEKAACYRCPTRWSLLYSLAWRTLFEERDLVKMGIDPQVSQLQKMYKAVGRDKHKMEAFVRFRRIDTKDTNLSEFLTASDEYYVSWFEPDHLILPITIPFFIKRFTNMSWSTLTPDGCAHWNQKEVIFTEGVHQRPKIEDSIETLWLTYYSHIFNPARVKLKMMQSEMPKKYWINLPEAPLIKELSRNAGYQLDTMLENTPSISWKKTQKSKFLKEKQKVLRAFSSNEEH